MIRVICGCLVMFGIAFSTVSAHTTDRSKASPPALSCPGYLTGACECRTQLPRAGAEKRILAAIGERFLTNPDWREAVYAAMSRAWSERMTSCPNDASELKSQINECERRIERMGALVGRVC
jgi:hypothetical protein